jgi:hypothetical protein
MLTYLLGPILSLFPKRWRNGLAFLKINWARAAAISGFLEFAFGVLASWKWYFVTMNFWVHRGLEVAMEGRAGPDVTDHAIGAAALLIWSNHPVTWLLAYVAVEGAVRFCGAAFSDSILGTLPLFVAGKIVGIVLPREKAEDPGPGVASSFFGAVSEKLLEKTQPAGADELIATRSGHNEFLEIRASRRKADWDPPRVVRIQDTYYRLESFTKGAPPRPFRYRLRRLTAGVPGRTVLIYNAEDAFVTEKQ